MTKQKAVTTHSSLFLVKKGKIVVQSATLKPQDESRHSEENRKPTYSARIVIAADRPAPNWKEWHKARELYLSKEEDSGPDSVVVVDGDGFPLPPWQGEFYDNYGNYYPDQDTVIYNNDPENGPGGRTDMEPWSKRYGG